MKKQLIVLALLCGVNAAHATGIASRVQSYVKGRGHLVTVTNKSNVQIEIFKSASHSWDKVEFIQPGESKKVSLIIPFQNSDKDTDGLYMTTNKFTVKLNDSNLGIVCQVVNKPQGGSVSSVVPLNIGISGGYYVLASVGGDISLTVAPDGSIAKD